MGTLMDSKINRYLAEIPLSPHSKSDLAQSINHNKRDCMGTFMDSKITRYLAEIPDLVLSINHDKRDCMGA